MTPQVNHRIILVAKSKLTNYPRHSACFPTKTQSSASLGCARRAHIVKGEPKSHRCPSVTRPRPRPLSHDSLGNSLFSLCLSLSPSSVRKSTTLEGEMVTKVLINAITRLFSRSLHCANTRTARRCALNTYCNGFLVIWYSGDIGIHIESRCYP